MAYDAARGQVVLFGGYNPGVLGDTWTWDGTEWIQRNPAHAPSARYGARMAYDGGHGQILLFGGRKGGGRALGDTWTWDGVDWGIPFRASIRLNPSSGPPGQVVQVKGWSFGASEAVILTFIDSTNGATKVATVRADATGAFTTQVTIPGNATLGKQKVKAKAGGSGQIAKRSFTVT
jgi:hypothetical protein